MKYSRTVAVALTAALMGSAACAAPPPATETKPTAKVQRWADARLVTALRAKDTPKINVVTAGEEQKSSYDQCAKAADVALCRVIVSAVSVAAIIGSSVPAR